MSSWCVTTRESQPNPLCSTATLTAPALPVPSPTCSHDRVGASPLASPKEVSAHVSTRAYEMMIIVDGDEEDAMVDDVVSRVETWLTEGGSRLASTEKWGKRKFAYEINHKTEGHYVVVEMVTEPRDMEPLERSLRLADEIVRHKLIRLPDHEAARRGLLEVD